MKQANRGKDFGSTGQRMLMAYNEISKSINPAKLLKVALTSSQMKVLINFSGQRFFTMTELGRINGVSVSTMTSMVDRLVQAGFLERQHDAADRRIVRVGLNAAGQKMVDYLMKVRRHELEKFLVELTPGEVQEFLQSIETVARYLAQAKKNMSRRQAF
jgi:MarR family transcriptional regulator, organic hydroperoxide resistance regulator